jgi:hypothetical protein
MGFKEIGDLFFVILMAIGLIIVSPFILIYKIIKFFMEQ